ncbi:type II secretion system F family protein [bacterium]|nr:type II secretion system F family protein [bacterium]
MKTRKIKQKKQSILDLDVSIGGIDLKTKAIFAKHLSVMLKAGLNIVEAIEITKEQASGKFKKVLSKILSSLNAGQSLAESFKRHQRVFSSMFVNIVGAGEISGNLEENLTNIAEQLEKERQLKEKIKGAMLYPAVVLGATFILGITMSFLVLPKITPLFEGLKVDLPFSTRALIWFSALVREQAIILFSGSIGFFILMVWLAKAKFSQPVTHRMLLKIPIIGKLTQQSNLARFCRSLGTLLKSGLNIDEALEVTKITVDNYYFRKALSKISNSLGKGVRLSTQLAKFEQYFPKLVTRMISVGEETGKLEESLLFLADFYELEADNTTKSLSTAIEPILLIFIGLVVAFLALSIITPIYQITGNIR